MLFLSITYIPYKVSPIETAAQASAHSSRPSIHPRSPAIIDSPINHTGTVWLQFNWFYSRYLASTFPLTSLLRFSGGKINYKQSARAHCKINTDPLTLSHRNTQSLAMTTTATLTVHLIEELNDEPLINSLMIPYPIPSALLQFPCNSESSWMAHN